MWLFSLSFFWRANAMRFLSLSLVLWRVCLSRRVYYRRGRKQEREGKYEKKKDKYDTRIHIHAHIYIYT